MNSDSTSCSGYHANSSLSSSAAAGFLRRSSATPISGSNPDSNPGSPAHPGSRPSLSPNRTVRRPSPLRQDSARSDDDEDEAGGRADDDEEGDEKMKMSISSLSSTSSSKSDGPSISVLPASRPDGTRVGGRLERTPSRRDSGSEVDDALGPGSFGDGPGSGPGSDFTSPFASAAAPATATGSSPSGSGGGSMSASTPGTREKDVIMRDVTPRASLGARTNGSGSGSRTLNYNPSYHDAHSPASTSTSASKSTSFIRPKPSFPRSAPLRPLTLTLSSSSCTSPGISSIVGTGGRYSTPHAGMTGAGGGKSSAAAGRQKVIVPKKGWKMSFDLGLTQSELARAA